MREIRAKEVGGGGGGMVRFQNYEGGNGISRQAEAQMRKEFQRNISFMRKKIWTS